MHQRLRIVLGYLSRRYIRAKSEARHSDNPEEEERKYREDVKAYLARFDFKPFFEE